MRWGRSVVVLFLAILGLVRGAVAEPAARAVARAQNALAFDLLRVLPGGNAFVSPLSISTLLSMVLEGARGVTADELRAALHLGEGVRTSDVARYGDELRHSSEATLQVANAVWVGKGEALVPAYAEAIRGEWSGQALEIDFGAPAAACDQINDWIAAHTGHMIARLIDRLDPSARLVLTNAIYMRALWTLPFDPAMTRAEAFHLAEGGVIQVPMMRQSGRYRVYPGDVVDGSPSAGRVLVLPYNGPLDLVIAMPPTADGLPELERHLTAERLEHWLERAEPCKLHVVIPRFKATARYELGEALQALGVHRLFGPQANLQGMLKAGGWVSRVVHQASVEVDERGTEASAATAAIVSRGIEPEFVADHPFLYLVVDRRSHAILFAGRMVRPDAKTAFSLTRPRPVRYILGRLLNSWARPGLETQDHT
jgi:serpin B